MEFIGKDSLQKRELIIKMPKCGGIRNQIPSDLLEERKKMENTLKYILRHYKSTKQEKRSGILEILQMHPYPR